MNQQRLEKYKSVVAHRQTDLAVILENVHDPHNIGAVLRSCDSVGVQEVFVIYTDDRMKPEKLEMGLSTSMGANKWIDLHYFSDIERCFTEVRSRYDRILGTRIEPPAENLYDLDLCGSVALLFGNEHDGVSPEANHLADGHFFIPQVGMVSSLNISVACAVSLYEAYRQRRHAGLYDKYSRLSEEQREELFQQFCKKHETALRNRKRHKHEKQR